MIVGGGAFSSKISVRSLSSKSGSVNSNAGDYKSKANIKRTAPWRASPLSQKEPNPLKPQFYRASNLPITSQINLKNVKDGNAAKRFISRNNSKGNQGMIQSGRWSNDTHGNSLNFQKSVRSVGSSNRSLKQAYGT